MLQYLQDSGMIDLPEIFKEMKMNKRKEILEQHKFAISQGKDSYWRTYIFTNGKRRLIKKKYLEDLEDALIDFYTGGKGIHGPKVKAVFKEWNDHRLEIGKIQKSTYGRYQQTFDRFFGDIQNIPIDLLTEDRLTEFLDEKSVGIRYKEWCNLITVAKGFMKRARKLKLINMDVMTFFAEYDNSDAVFIKSRTPSEDQVFTEEEYPLLVEYLCSHRDILNLGLLLILTTGIRVGELAALKKSDFADPQIFHVTRTEQHWIDENGKTQYSVSDERTKTEAGRRLVVVPEDFAFIYDEIMAQSSDDEWLFSNEKGRIRAYNFGKRLSKICKEFGWVSKSPHDGRRTYVSILLDHCVDQNFLLRQVGHTNIDMSETYYHKDRKAIETKKAIVSGISEFKLSDNKPRRGIRRVI